jgi:nodulation protein E
MNRVVVTGRGVVSAIGRGMDEFTRALETGALGIDKLAGMPQRIGATVRNFDPHAEFDASHLSMLDRSTQFALVCADEAIAESGLEGELGPRAAVIIGTGVGACPASSSRMRCSMPTATSGCIPSPCRR